MATMFKYHRFADLDAMRAGAFEIVREYWAANETFEQKPYAESGIYTDDNGLSFRPQVSIICDQGVHVLRWNAYADQLDIDHMGKRARVEARDAAGWFTDQIQTVITNFNVVAFRDVEPAAADQEADQAETVDHVEPAAVVALREIAALLDDWPTMRALSAAGATKATENKAKAREIIRKALESANGTL